MILDGLWLLNALPSLFYMVYFESPSCALESLRKSAKASAFIIFELRFILEV